MNEEPCREWVSLRAGDKLPTHRVLCTNNLHAKDKQGRMSHVYFGYLDYRTPTSVACWSTPGKWEAINITHYKEVL